MVVHESDPHNAEPPPDALAGEARTGVDAFYVRNHGPVPEIDAATWRLRVDGLVDAPLELSQTGLRERFVAHTLAATLQCAGNRRADLLAVRAIPGEHPWGPAAISTAEWTGVRLADLLADAGVTSGAAHVCFSAPDVAPGARPPQPYGSSIPLGKAMSDEVLLAWAMNGEPLAPVHGYPLRVVVPGWIGARSVKWLERITVSAEPSDNYFQASAYRLLPADADPKRSTPGAGHSLGPLALTAAILTPVDGAKLPTGRCAVRGYAHAGDDRTVVRVDVSTDGGGSWRQAQLDDPASAWTWQHWRADIELPSGPVEIVARAWDSTGALQPSSPEHVWNPKGYLNNSWPRVRVVAR